MPIVTFETKRGKKMTHIAQREEALTAREAATYLGHHINTIRRWIHKKQIPATRIGRFGQFKILKSDLDEARQFDPDSEPTELSA